jgi:hypothetical protein
MGSVHGHLQGLDAGHWGPPSPSIMHARYALTPAVIIGSAASVTAAAAPIGKEESPVHLSPGVVRPPSPKAPAPATDVILALVAIVVLATIVYFWRRNALIPRANHLQRARTGSDGEGWQAQSSGGAAEPGISGGWRSVLSEEDPEPVQQTISAPKITGNQGSRLYRGEVSTMAAPLDGKSALAFRLRTHDASGSPLPILHVEMPLTRKRLIGGLARGDEVEFEGHLDHKGIVRTKKIRNLTTRTSVTTKLNNMLFVNGLFGLLFFFGFALAVVGFFLSGRSGASPIFAIGLGLTVVSFLLAVLFGIIGSLF